MLLYTDMNETVSRCCFIGIYPQIASGILKVAVAIELTLLTGK